MASFDLGRFRELAFGRKALPDHPLRELADAQKMLAELPADSDAALAELTLWASSMNATESFTPGRRAQILMALDDASRPRWRTLATRYLAPEGRPLEGRDGDPDLLRALFDIASEFATGFALVLDSSERESRWVEENQARLHLRNMRWLSRRLALSHMLALPASSAIWERLHRLHRLAEERAVARSVLPVFEGDPFSSSPRQEYVRALLLELANPGSLRGREIELAFRITARVAQGAQLEAQPGLGFTFAVVPAADARPTLTARLPASPAAAPYYLGTANCLPRLAAALERDMGRDPREPDTLYGPEFTLRERFAMIRRLQEYWGPKPPRRRSRRLPLASAARVVSGFDSILEVLPPLDRSAPEDKPAQSNSRLQIDITGRALNQVKAPAAARVRRARVIDASTGGLGIAVRRPEASWARHGALVGICIAPGTDWVVGVVRRIFSMEEELRLGVQVLAARPRVATLGVELLERPQVWADAMRFDADFGERYKRCIVPDEHGLPLAVGELVLPPALAATGVQFDLRLPVGVQRIGIARLLDDNEHFQRVLFDSLGVS